MSREWRLGDVVDAYVPTRSRRHRLIYLGAAGGTWPWRLLDASNEPEPSGIGLDNIRDPRLLLSPLDLDARLFFRANPRMNVGRSHLPSPDENRPANGTRITGGMEFTDEAIDNIARGLARREHRLGLCRGRSW